MSLTLSVYSHDRRARRPLAVHADLLPADANDLAAVYELLGHQPPDIRLEHSDPMAQSRALHIGRREAIR